MPFGFINRFVTAFLLLALLGGTGAWLLTLPPSPAAPPGGSASSKPVNLSGQSAFVEKLPELARTASETPVPSQTNLTDRLAQTLGENILAANPEGPVLDSNGQLKALAPDSTSTIESFFKDPEIYGPIVKDTVRMATARSDPKKLTLIKDPSKEEEAAYLQNLLQTLQTYFLDSKVRQMLTGEPSLEAVSAQQVALGQLSLRLEAIRVPASYLDLHLAAENMILHFKNFMATPLSENDDPLRTMLAIEQQGTAVQVAANNFAGALSAIDFKRISGLPVSGPGGFSLIPIANAQWVVIDPAVLAAIILQTAKQTAMDIVKWFKTFALQVVRNMLVHRIIQQTITWIQGGGKPQFVTNWKKFLLNVGNDAAGMALQAANPALCQSFGPLIRLNFQPVNLPPEQPVTCTLDRVVSNIREFYNSFSDGSWLAYGAVMRPQNNYFGAVIETSDMLARAQAEAEEASRNEAQSGKGYLGAQSCSNWKNYGSYANCMKETDDKYFCSKISPQFKYCLEGSITTPPATIGDITARVLPASLDNVISAQDIAGLINALAQSALSKLVNKLRGSNGDNPGILDPDLKAAEPMVRFGQTCTGLGGAAHELCKTQVLEACEDLPPNMRSDCAAGIAPPVPEEGGGVPPGAVYPPPGEPGTPPFSTSTEPSE